MDTSTYKLGVFGQLMNRSAINQTLVGTLLRHYVMGAHNKCREEACLLGRFSYGCFVSYFRAVRRYTAESERFVSFAETSLERLKIAA